MKKELTLFVLLLSIAGAVMINGDAKAQSAPGGPDEGMIDCDTAYPVLCAQVGSVIYYGKIKKNP